MSRYSDKRRRAVACAAPNCDDHGQALRLVAGRPDWYCEKHARVIDEHYKR